MDLARLRQETAGEHAATEETVPLMRADLSRAQYGDVLRRFLRVVRAWDAWSDAHAPADLLPLLAGRRRASLLEDDLRALDAEPGDDASMLPAMETSAVAGDARSVFLGRMYVMEGSTLGGQYIAKHVEDVLGLQHGAGNSYFAGYGSATGERWNEFRQVLAALPDHEAATVIASAKNMFALFGRAMRDENL